MLILALLGRVTKLLNVNLKGTHLVEWDNFLAILEKWESLGVIRFGPWPQKIKPTDRVVG